MVSVGNGVVGNGVVGNGVVGNGVVGGHGDGEVGHDCTLALEHPADVDTTSFGNHELQQQLAAEIAEMRNGRGQPPAQLCPTGARRSEHRAVAAGDSRLLADRSNEPTLDELVE